MGTSTSIGLLFWIICFLFSTNITYLFTDDEAVIHTVSQLSLLLAFSALFASIYPVLSGVAIGSGLQTKVAVINLVCFYGIGLPVGVVLGYVLHLQVEGIWLGLTFGVLTETCAMIFLVWKTDWEKQVINNSNKFFIPLTDINYYSLRPIISETFLFSVILRK